MLFYILKRVRTSFRSLWPPLLTCLLLTGATVVHAGPCPVCGKERSGERDNPDVCQCPQEVLSPGTTEALEDKTLTETDTDASSLMLKDNGTLEELNFEPDGKFVTGERKTEEGTTEAVSAPPQLTQAATLCLSMFDLSVAVPFIQKPTPEYLEILRKQNDYRRLLSPHGDIMVVLARPQDHPRAIGDYINEIVELLKNNNKVIRLNITKDSPRKANKTLAVIVYEPKSKKFIKYTYNSDRKIIPVSSEEETRLRSQLRSKITRSAAQHKEIHHFVLDPDNA